MKVIINHSSNLSELQSQFCFSNCIYIIGIEQQTYGTKTSPLVIPENSTLIFEGGKFIGGYVKLNNTSQNDIYYTVWENVKISGKFNNEILRPEWFGAIGNGIHDDTIALQQCIDLASQTASSTKLLGKKYKITHTIKIITGTVLEGLLPGDYYIYNGTEIIAELLNDRIALDINSANDTSGCYKFILRNFGLIMGNSVIPTTALRLYSISNTCPREGLIEGVFAFGFSIGFDLNAFSYVKIQRIDISHCTIGINIAKIGGYTEFMWLDDIYINTDAPNAIGIKLEGGSNIYFNKIDIAGCIKGFWMCSLNAIFNIFINRLSVENCLNCICIHAQSQYITRIKLSEITIYSLNNNSDGIIFSRNPPFNIEDSIFNDLFDASPTNNNFIKIEEIGMDTCVFNGIRTYNKLTGFSHVKKVEILRIHSSGTFIIPEGTNEHYKYIVSSFSPLDFAPIAMLSTARSFDYSYVCSNIQMGELSITIKFNGILDKPLLLCYNFPQL